ncbi:glycosyltransferase family 1 protein [Cytobacillus purgationiresistens]|uniref:Glycosyltransferase involved in cell wall biosynthesis n=1 Tax=Cytobacillus purgationiresistens TaxID=863449 RepID=A0ABU0AI52_9BACI|nr:glycosyltransferase family 1 protein [Cytobacillus purgationiresistens]MDQ0270925.1 glycosyltransferase involved in cell wall biosynthesis [Cytobacillus purgationiresistens]
MGSPLRILHVVVNMNRGGAETLIMNLYRHIDRSKVQFDFLTCKPGVFDEEIKVMGGIIHRIPYVSDVGHFKYISELEGFFKANHQYQIVHSHMDKMSGFVLKAAKESSIPIRIAHSHNTKSEGGTAIRLYKWWAGTFIVPSSTDYFACSSEAAKWLFRQQYSKAKMVKNGIAFAPFYFALETRRKVREELELDHGIFAIGHVGRFAKQKNHSFLIELYAEYERVNKNSVLLLLGDGHLREEMERKVRDLGLKDKVRFLGIRDDVNEVLQAMDLFVFPSFHEGLPVTLIEAQGAGLPCIISDQISSEADLDMNLVEYLPLSNTSMWVDSIKRRKSAKIERRSDKEPLVAKGYDISRTATSVQALYLSYIGAP